MKNGKFQKRLAYSLQGLKSAWLSEKSFRTQVVIAFLVIIFLIIMKPSAVWCAIFSLIISATVAAELMNTALESLFDFLHPDLHPAVGRAKDCAAAAVLILSLSSLTIMGAFLYERLCQ